MEKKFTPISEIKAKLDEKKEVPLLTRIKNQLLNIIIPIIAFIIIVNPFTLKKITQNPVLELSVGDTLKSAGGFTVALLLGIGLNFCGFI